MSARAEAAAAVRTAVVLTHTHPEQTSAALRDAIAAAERVSCALAATPAELEKHGEAAGGIEVSEDLPERPDLCLVLGGDGTILSALRHYAGTGVPVFGINFGTVGFLAAVEREQLADGLSRAFGGDFEVMHLPGTEAGDRYRAADRPQRRFVHPPPSRPGRRALLPARGTGGRPRAL